MDGSLTALTIVHNSAQTSPDCSLDTGVLEEVYPAPASTA